MALSNWDTLAFNEEGKPCEGCVNNENGDGIEIYKNFLYVRSPKMWAEGGSYIEPTIAQVASGSIHIAGFDIEAIRGPQNAVFCLITHHTKDYKPRYFGGIGCYGYEDVGDLLAKCGRVVPEEELDDWMSGSRNYSLEDEKPNPDGTWTQVLTNYKTREEIVHTFETEFVGVRPTTLEAYFKWLDSQIGEYDKELKIWVDKCKSADALRFNQGDKFFSDQLGLDLETSAVGETDKPIMEKILEAK